MFNETSALDKSFPCNPPPVTPSAISLPSLRLVAPVSTSVPPIHSPNGLMVELGYCFLISSVLA